MTSTSAWSDLFHGLPNNTPASQLYTEEAIQNDQLTAEEIIEKAQNSANLLYELVTAIDEKRETLRGFEKNDLLQTIFQECQEMSTYLSVRIWDDSEDSNARYQTFESSSSSAATKTADEEAQIAAFIASHEQLQVAVNRYNELKDYLSAKSLQESDLVDNFDYGHPTYTESRNTHTSAVAALDDQDDDELERGMDNTHLRKSEQPLIWKLDPREDFRANKTKMKKINQDELKKAVMVRHMEKNPRNGVHGLAEDPFEIKPDMLTKEDSLEDGAVNESAGESTTEPRVEVDEDGLERIINHSQVGGVEEEEEEEEDNEDAKSENSDDSWEEIPSQGIVDLSINEEANAQQQDVVSPTNSSISSFTMVAAESNSRTPTPPSTTVLES
ncbi:hypothetical protein BGZ76_004848 [Entomortierella beljakovae]|nr:hypothetical protein BGZ76_004848 [Entomortierella beljakovae]